MKQIIENNALALATVDENKNPHSIAVGDVKVVEGSKLLVEDNFMEETVQNLKRNSNVSLTVWNRNWEEDCKGYELKGTADYFTEGKWKERVEDIHKGFPAKGAILIEVGEIKDLA